ncbi:hypothetical protein C6500_20255 [Candidatus Poribacteria bacterium]|nr:MAG: hypothetical protein C6500_20255 [Candidatus Poribacteria bacterium]
MKSVSIIVTLFFLPFSVSAGTFVETFDDEDLQDWQDITMVNLDAAQAAWEVIDDELQGMSQAPLVSLLTIGDKTWQDYTVEFDVKPTKKHGPGSIAIAARKKKTWIVTCMIGDMKFPAPESRATCFSGDFHENRYVVIKWEAVPLLTLETWSHLKLSVHDTTFTLWINGKQVLEARDQEAKFLTGGVGFGIANYTAKFDNLVISGDSIPNKGRLSVTPKDKLATIWGKLKVNP